MFLHSKNVQRNGTLENGFPTANMALFTLLHQKPHTPHDPHSPNFASCSLLLCAALKLVLNKQEILCNHDQRKSADYARRLSQMLPAMAKSLDFSYDVTKGTSVKGTA
jgi:hypothetical protein